MTAEIEVGAREGWVERGAKLFEAGEYPDKGIAVSDDDLAALVAGFSEPVRVLIEHAESPLELGFLTAVTRQGRELHGTVSLSAEADALVRRSGARGLSLGLSPDLRSIREVSLVRNPRVSGAGFFSASESVEFSGCLSPLPPLQDEPLGEWETLSTPHPLHSPARGGGFGFSTPGPSSFSSRSEDATFDISAPRKNEEGCRLTEMVREGRLVPAQVPFAEALLACEGVVEFSGDRRPLRELLIALLERQPPLALFGQAAPVRFDRERPTTMLPEEAEFYTRHFPGVPLTDIAQAKGR